jgi:hypothetical protein
MNWITTFSGLQVDLLDPQPDQFCIEDIAHALSMLVRFAGHVSQFYSVAEHSVRVARACPPHLRLLGLLHDAHEAYVNDWSTPLKASLSDCAIADFRRMEARLIAAIGEALGIELHHDPTVKHFDRALLRAESELLLPEPIAGWFDLPDEKLPPIVSWSQRKAREIFLATFRQLTEPLPPVRRVFELVAA